MAGCKTLNVGIQRYVHQNVFCIELLTCLTSSIEGDRLTFSRDAPGESGLYSKEPSVNTPFNAAFFCLHKMVIFTFRDVMFFNDFTVKDSIDYKLRFHLLLTFNDKFSNGCMTAFE